MLRRYGAGVTLVLDGDEAGLNAAERGVNVALEAGVDARVAVVEGAKDPFDLIRTGGPEALQAILDKARDAFDFKLDLVRARNDLKRPVEAEQALRELAETVARSESDSLRELYARKVAVALGLREAAVLAAVGGAHAKHTDQAARTTEHPAPAAPRDSRAMYEREVLRRLFEHPVALSAAGETVFPEMFSTPGLQALYREMVNAWDEHGELVPGALLAHLPPEAKPELEAVLEHVQVPENQSANSDEQALLLKELQKFAQHAQLQGSGVQSLEALRQKKGRKGPRRA
jgi:DNA primase